MQKKLRLKQADEYDYSVATLYAAQAVIAYLEGNEQCQRIGNEQGDVDEWDDIVLHEANGKVVHCQVKRQMKDFSNDEPTRGLKKKGENKGDKQDLSAIDKAFRGLAVYYDKPASERVGFKKFRLSIPNPNIQIKKDLTVLDLRNVCTELCKAGANVDTFSNTGSSSEKVRKWLSSWCGFRTDDLMFECLRSLEILEHGDESRLDSEIHDKLNVWYSTPDDVGRIIRDFIAKNASSEQSITPRMIAYHIDRFIIPQKRTFARYNTSNPLNWEISGTLTGHQTNIESAGDIVNRLWNPVSNRNYELQLGYKCVGIQSCSLQLSLIRLALHVIQGIAVSAVGSDGWHATVSQTVRMTLGNSEDDLDVMRWIDSSVTPSLSDHRKLHTTRLVNEEALELRGYMDTLTWERVKSRVSTIIARGKPNEVRDAVEIIWNDWQDEIDKDPLLQHELLTDMLYAKSEGNENIGVLRSGLRTVRLIAEAVHMLLHLIVASGTTDHSWRCFRNEYSVRTVALTCWAGPHQHLNEIRRFFDDDDSMERAEFLGKETARLLVLPQARSSESAIYGKSLADGRDGGDNFAESRAPISILTQSQEYKNALRQETIASLKDFFSTIIQGREAQRTHHINMLITKAHHAN